MRLTPRILLTIRLVGIVIVGIALPTAATLMARLVEPRILSEVWAGRTGGPFALLTGLVVEWMGVLERGNRWLRSGPALLAVVAGILLVYRTRRAVACVPQRMLR